MIEVKNLTKRYGNHLAVDHLNFTVESGKIYGFLGPNGAGKSTTMNIMTGYLDSKSTIEIMNILKDLHKSGRTVIIITHDDEIANQVDRVVRIMDGKIVSDSVNQ